MDYKYIEQLLERYWQCETSLQEEEILRSFFAQDNVPVSLLTYRDLFVSQAKDKQDNVLGDDFDARILAKVEGDKPVKANTITMRQRLMPLFKAAAIVAIVITIGNAAQMAFDQSDAHAPEQVVEGYNKIHHGSSVAKADSAKVDSLNKRATPTASLMK